MKWLIKIYEEAVFWIVNQHGAFLVKIQLKTKSRPSRPGHFRFFIEAFLVRLQVEMRSWSTQFWHTDHDWKLEIHFEKGCLHPQEFNFVRRLLVQHSLQLTRLRVGRFRCCIEAVLVKLHNKMRSWSTWYWVPDHDWKLEIHFENLLFTSSRIQFRSEVACATFYAGNYATCRSFQMFHWSFFGEVIVWKVTLHRRRCCVVVWCHRRTVVSTYGGFVVRWFRRTVVSKGEGSCIHIFS